MKTNLVSFSLIFIFASHNACAEDEPNDYQGGDSDNLAGDTLQEGDRDGPWAEYNLSIYVEGETTPINTPTNTRCPTPTVRSAPNSKGTDRDIIASITNGGDIFVQNAT